MTAAKRLVKIPVAAVCASCGPAAVAAGTEPADLRAVRAEGDAHADRCGSQVTVRIASDLVLTPKAAL
jgi:hypothetical protein